MAYRFEKNPVNGTKELVIDGFEKGIANSPYKGISNIVGLNINYYEGAAYVNYKRQACTFSGATLGRPVASTQSPSGLIYISDDGNHIFKQNSVNSNVFTAIGSNPGTGAGGILWWNNYLLSFRSANTIDICGDGTGDTGISSSNWNTGAGTGGVWPIDTASITTTGSFNAGDTTATISTYADAKGNNRAFWNGPTGTYLATLGAIPSTQYVYVNLEQGSSAVSWTPAATASAAALITVYPLQNGNINGYHPSLVSRNDNNAYFGHQNYLAYIGIVSGFTSAFTKTNFKTFQYVGTALALPTSEQIQWLEELVGNLIVGGNYNLYPWDRLAVSWQNPVPVQEGICKFVNILNKIYIFAGNKGNIYVSNGYSVNRFVKIPDYISGTIDPVWAVGGQMVHRQKLFFQATAYNTSGVPTFTGILSVNLDTSAITVENVNSTASGSTTDYHGVLVDNEIAQASLNPPGFSTNYDSFYSGWCTLSGGVYTGTTDYNNASLYGSSEAYIETDLIPVGTTLSPFTPTQVEYKLDRPLANGDSISLYVRDSLTASYTLLGTTTATATASTQVVSAQFPSTVQNLQWAQFKIVPNCASSSSSRIPIREARLR